MRRIQLTQGKFALIDDEDFDFVNQWRWYYGGRGYAIRHSKMIKGKRTKIYMHRIISNAPIDMEVDHINQDRIDNRKENLRICTRMENLHNQKTNKNNRSGYKGVFYIKEQNKWGAVIGINNKIINLGRYNNKIEAAQAYNKAAKKYHGKFAYLN